MAYKDEYEVARLHVETGFLDEVAREFEGGYRVVHHLAPPLVPAKPDGRGRPTKRAFGPWIRTPFRWLARMKRLRGTALDPFGYTAERRMERELARWFESVVDGLAARVGTAPHEELVVIAKAPMEIRGFGPVKEEAVAKVRPEMERRLALLVRQPATDVPHAA